MTSQTWRPGIARSRGGSWTTLIGRRAGSQGRAVALAPREVVAAAWYTRSRKNSRREVRRSRRSTSTLALTLTTSRRSPCRAAVTSLAGIPPRAFPTAAVADNCARLRNGTKINKLQSISPSISIVSYCFELLTTSRRQASQSDHLSSHA